MRDVPEAMADAIGPVIRVLDCGIAWGENAYEKSATQRTVESTAKAFRTAPLRFIGIIVLGTILASFVYSATTASLSPAGIGVHAAILLAAILGMFVDLTWAELLETRPVRLLVRLLEPPEPPEAFEDEE